MSGNEQFAQSIKYSRQRCWRRLIQTLYVLSSKGDAVVKESRFTKWWGLTRKKGKTRYILFNGVLLFGVPMLIFMSFVTNPFANGFFSGIALVHDLSWLIAGLVYGLIMWHYFEYKFAKEKAKHGPT